MLYFSLQEMITESYTILHLSEVFCVLCIDILFLTIIKTMSKYRNFYFLKKEALSL